MPANFEDTPDYNLYRALDESKTPGSEQENKRITEIMDMLSTAKIFSNDRQILGDYTNLHTIMSWLDKDRKSTRLNSSHPTTSRMPSSA